MLSLFKCVYMFLLLKLFFFFSPPIFTLFFLSHNALHLVRFARKSPRHNFVLAFFGHHSLHTYISCTCIYIYNKSIYKGKKIEKERVFVCIWLECDQLTNQRDRCFEIMPSRHLSSLVDTYKCSIFIFSLDNNPHIQ